MLGPMFTALPENNIPDCDCFIQIVFRDIQDYINVKNDPHYMQVVVPDHKNFADHKRTTMATGWFEKHIAGGQVVKGEETQANGANGVNGH